MTQLNFIFRSGELLD